MHFMCDILGTAESFSYLFAVIRRPSCNRKVMDPREGGLLSAEVIKYSLFVINRQNVAVGWRNGLCFALFGQICSRLITKRIQFIDYDLETIVYRNISLFNSNGLNVGQFPVFAERVLVVAIQCAELFQ